MKRNAIILTLLIAILLSACAANANIPTEPIPTDPPSIDLMTEPPVASPEPIESEPIMTEPLVQKLSILPGSYLDTFCDPDNGSEMDYYLHIPENATANMPLIIFLHGDGEVGNPYILKNFGLMESARTIYGNEFPFIGLSPSTDVKSWIDDDIPNTLKNLIDTIIESYAIDSCRVIITGHSRGAIGVWNMISLYGDFFAAAVPVSSPHQKGHIDFGTASLVPVWSFAGNIGESELWKHKWLQYNKNAILNNGGWAEFTVLPGCDHGETATAAFSQETFEWMLLQTNKEN